MVKYCEMDQVIDAYIERNKDSNNADTALKELIKAFKILSEKHQSLAVKNFTSLLKKYYHCKKERFFKLYERRLEFLEKEEVTQHEGDLVEMEAVKKGVQDYKRKLNKSMDNANNKPKSPMTTERTKQNDSNATSQASATFPIKSTATSPPLRIKIPTSALKPVSSPTVAPIVHITTPIISPRLPLSTNTQTMHHVLNTSIVSPTSIPVYSPILSRSTTTSTSAPNTNIDFNKIKKTITARAKSIHDPFAQGDKVSLSDFKLMSSSLSSIIDLVDQNDDSQRQLFTVEEWDTLNEYLLNTYNHTPYSLPPILRQTWQLLSKISLLPFSCKTDLI